MAEVRLLSKLSHSGRKSLPNILRERTINRLETNPEKKRDGEQVQITSRM